ncbi:hypothetical protein KM043_002664 [Ampulex compressa]|nr:hypothetical protein KM043_002664 [Ampulex compressa]
MWQTSESDLDFYLGFLRAKPFIRDASELMDSLVAVLCILDKISRFVKPIESALGGCLELLSCNNVAGVSRLRRGEIETLTGLAFGRIGHDCEYELARLGCVRMR